MKWKKELLTLAAALFGADAVKLNHEESNKKLTTAKVSKDQDEDAEEGSESTDDSTTNEASSTVNLSESSKKTSGTPGMLNEPPPAMAAVPVPSMGAAPAIPAAGAPPMMSSVPVVMPAAPPAMPATGAMMPPAMPAAMPAAPPMMGAAMMGAAPPTAPPTAPMMPPMGVATDMNLEPLPDILPPVQDPMMTAMPAMMPAAMPGMMPAAMPGMPIVAASPGTAMMPMTVAPVPPAMPHEVPPPPMTPWEQYAHEIDEEMAGVSAAMDDSDLTGPAFQHELQTLSTETTPEMAMMFHQVLEKMKVMKDVLVDPVLAERRSKLVAEKHHAEFMMEHQDDPNEPMPPAHPPTMVPVLPMPQADPAVGMAEGQAPPPNTKPSATTVLLGAAMAAVVFGAAFYVLKK